jgi:hypothetical protein
MEHLFSPCTRLRAMLDLESQGRLEKFRDRHEDLQEQSLDVSIEELLSAETGFTYADLYAMLGNENAVLWLTPHAAIVPEGGKGLHAWMLLDWLGGSQFSADGKALFVFARSLEHLSEICDVVLRLLTASAVHSVRLFK